MVTVTHRTSVGDRFQQWSKVELPNRVPKISWSVGNLANNLSILFRRLALVSFIETMIASYLVHRAEEASIAVNTNVGAILVLVAGLFLTILLCAAAWMLSEN